MKKLLTALLALMLCASVFTLASCKDNSGDKGEGNTRNPEINAVYVAYVAYAAEQGEDLLEYAEWLEAVKSEGASPNVTVSSDGKWLIDGVDVGISATATTAGEADETSVKILRVEASDDGQVLVFSTDGLSLAITPSATCVGDHSFGGEIIIGDSDDCASRVYGSLCAACGTISARRDEHTEPVLFFDGYGHWKGCGKCEFMLEYGNHVLDAGGDCTLCGATDDYDVHWEKTPIIMQYNLSQDGKTFPSGAKRYYTGADEWGDSMAMVDVAVRERNRNAELATGVSLKHEYLPDVLDNEWGMNAERLYNSTVVYRPGISIDIFSDYMYDMMVTMLKNRFANLKSSEGDASAADKANFSFNSPDYSGTVDDYFDMEAGEGYFYSFMLSLTLVPDRIYFVASNYTTDVIRTMGVIPVNIKLLESISADKLPSADGVVYREGMTNLEYLYELVWSGKWDYEMLSAFSRAVYVDRGEKGADITDTLGFALPISGARYASNAMVYTTAPGLLSRIYLTPDERDAMLRDPKLDNYVVGDYFITYPEENAIAVGVAEALNSMFMAGDENGICAAYDKKEIRSAFNNSTVLFGSVVPLYELENDDYQTTRAAGSLGIIPVPVYQSWKKYNTNVHDNARLIAIGRHCTNLEICAAFIDYQTKHSGDVLRGYFTEYFGLGKDTENDPNVKMLTYIKNHALDGFDRALEGIVQYYYYDRGYQYERNFLSFSDYFLINKYQIKDMNNFYPEFAVYGRGEWLDEILEDVKKYEK